MSYYVYSKELSYIDYLKAQSFIDINDAGRPKILINIPAQLRALVSNQEVFEATNIDYIELPDKDKPFDRLSYPVRNMLSARGDINALFHNAYSKYLIQIDVTQLNSEEISRLFKLKTDLNPLGHTALAKIAFIDGEYIKARDEAEKAIQEYEKLPKLTPDWGLYFILGIIYLGFVDCDFSLVDLEKSEQTFLKATQLLQAENSFECARAFLAAGWSAYCRGDFTAAEELVNKSIALKGNLAEARFILAKIMFAANEIDNAFVFLGRAIESDPFYVFKAAGETDFQQHEDKLINLFVSLRSKYILFLQSLQSEFDKKISNKDIKAELRRRINLAIESNSLSLILYKFKELSNESWIVTKGDFIIRIEDEIVIKEGGLFSKPVVKKIFNESKARTINYDLIGRNHNIALSLSLHFIEDDNGSFYLGRIPVTQALWNYVMGKKTDTASELFYPIFEVTWYDCIKFCNKLSQMLNIKPYYSIRNNVNQVNWLKGTIECDPTSEGFRLPTDAEWFYAAKGGKLTHSYLYSGSNDPDEVAWYNTNSKRKLQKVAQKKPNELGLYDMSGNVWEWCWNQYKETDRRILRGGAFFYDKDQSTVISIGHAQPDNPGMTNGFRIAKSILDPSEVKS